MWYNYGFMAMTDSVTTSIRMTRRLREHLERRARATGKGKNWIINEALRRYLELDDPEYESQARRQSQVASTSSAAESGDWSEAADLDQWK